jgi:outer membrane protein OmpA-like peptidoglycan-associated protein/tetratricopeptide (TPR) repeat protein
MLNDKPAASAGKMENASCKVFRIAPAFLAFCIALLLQGTSFSQKSQQSGTSNKKAGKYFDSAMEAYMKRDNERAMQEVSKAIAEDSVFCEALVLKGDLLSDGKHAAEAIDMYKKVMRINSVFSINLLFITGGLELYLGRYADAKADYSKYLEGKNIPDVKRRKSIAQLASAEFGMAAVSHPVPFNPVNLGDSINTRFDEYINAITADEESLYFTRKVPRSEKNPALQGYEEDFYISTAHDSIWSKARNLGPPVNTPGNEGALNISPDGKYLFFAGCDRPDGFGSCDIYWAKRSGNSWLEPENLGEVVNSPSWDSQPSFSSDGKTLYFASKRSGGKGSSDIWKTELRSDGSWSEPVNLGDSINTPYEEMSPFIHPDGQTLYFASRGHPGMGGYDLFYSRKKEDGSWSKAKNLGYPINTQADEMVVIVNAKGDKAFISSDKLGGKGREDIYSFPLYPEARPVPSTYFKGIVFDNETGNKLQANFELTNLGDAKTVAKSFSDPVTGEFLLVLPSDKDYALNVSRDGYLFYSDNFSLKGIHTFDQPFIKNIALKPLKVGEVLVLRNIFFDTDKYILKPESVTELQKLLALMMKNPSIRVELGGHTDNMGTPAHNIELSRNRAKAVYEYLVENGIAKGRMSYEGFGLTRPVDSNDTELGRANNRRTECKIIGM